MTLTWLLILCVGPTAAPCFDSGGLTAIMVTKEQCRAALSVSDEYRSWCIGPKGEIVFSREAKK